MNRQTILVGAFTYAFLIHPVMAEMSSFVPEDKAKISDRDASIYFFGEVNDKKVIELQSSIDTMIGNYPKLRHINLYISSLGGSMDAGWAGYWAVKNSPIPIRTINLSRIASAATLIYCGGAERSALPGTSFLLHPASKSVHSDDYKPDFFERMQADLALANQMFSSTYKSCTNLSVDEISQTLKAEYFAKLLTADDAVKIGLAGKILDKKYPDATSAYIVDGK
ncbi:ATP-dependent Clp protease proteolytic subunit [Brucella intermedia]|uniref:ATP-dependent Clp protease proteolytic subunit n=1 Tax=Brucella intermedia TaxID=94625 RepID=UPI00124F06D2|nr:ATP-dependent Clp protease proteolytic subunit [Brucella intermedia]KAB2715423.1 peptidase S14 [Brucella intermedia]KAB2720859.1 peptidase S14 [Brucella intermedia]